MYLRQRAASSPLDRLTTHHQVKRSAIAQVVRPSVPYCRYGVRYASARQYGFRYGWGRSVRRTIRLQFSRYLELARTLLVPYRLRARVLVLSTLYEFRFRYLSPIYWK